MYLTISIILAGISLFLVFRGSLQKDIIWNHNNIIKQKNNIIEDYQNRLAFAGKNYIEKTNSLKEEIRKLKKINENKKATPKRQSRQTVQRTNKKKI